MRPLFCLLLSLMVITPVKAEPQTAALPDTAFYSVFYVEVSPSAKANALAEIKRYREASAKEPGYIRIELFEQAGRPAHFVMIETWATDKAFDTHRMAAHTMRLLNQLQLVRLSDYDQRPYKTLSVAGAPPTPNNRT